MAKKKRAAKRSKKKQGKRSSSTSSKRAPRARTTEWKAQFLVALKLLRSPSLAAEQAGINRNTAYAARKIDGEFRRAWEEIWEGQVDALEASAMERATNGTDSLKVSVRGDLVIDPDTGKPIVEKKHEGNLTIFMLKKTRKQYADNEEGASTEEAVLKALELLAAMKKATGGAR